MLSLPVPADAAAALAAPDVVVDFGVDLLDGADAVVEDISADVVSFTVERSMYADVHGTCEIQLLRDLAWGVDRVSPWLSVSGKVWPLGVFFLTSPEMKAGEEPRTRSVSGMDKLWLLRRPVGDTFVINAGTSYLDAIRSVLAASGVTGQLFLQGDRQDTLLEDPAVWLLTEEPTSWLRVVNDLLNMIGYRGLWVDGLGRFRSEPYVSPLQRAAGWIFDTSDAATNIVGEDRSATADLFDAPNWWRFVRRGQAVIPQPGYGMYTVDRVGSALPNRKVVFLDAADQASLVAQGDRIVDQDTQNNRLVTLESSPLPAGHFDVVSVTDPGLGLSGARCQARRWAVTSEGAMTWELEVLA